jgi:ribonuclease HI
LQQTDSKRWVITTDGGCRNNPGAGAWGFVARLGDLTVTKGGFLPHTTCNQAEYRAFTAACIWLLYQNNLPCCVEFWSDSQLIVNQLNGKWGVKTADLLPFHQDAKKALTELRTRVYTTVNWFRREHNSEADAVCNRIMDLRGVVCDRKGKQSRISKPLHF